MAVKDNRYFKRAWYSYKGNLSQPISGYDVSVKEHNILVSIISKLIVCGYCTSEKLLLKICSYKAREKTNDKWAAQYMESSQIEGNEKV